jgi:hypothetical protein
VKKEIYDQLAATGKYYNTGKVLVGSACERPRHELNADEQEIQAILLGSRPTRRQGERLLRVLWYVATAAVILAIILLGERA